MLNKLSNFPGVQGPVVIIVMDGYGIPKTDVGSAIAAARKPTLDRLFADYPHITLRAHGTAVGMPSDDDMGNSEVGHNAIGAGQVYSQGAALVANAIASGAIWEGEAWQQVVGGAKAGRGVIHFIGLFSDGNVHSHIDHLKAMIVQAKADGVPTVRIHALLDGRDVPETSALEYVLPFEAFLAEISNNNFDAQIASGGGRQNITMDRYDANWAMVDKGWQTHVLGHGQQFSSASVAVNALREQFPKTIDQDLPPFVIARDGKPVGTIEDGDGVVFFNFRGDRAIEITRAFEEAHFDKFDRVRLPKVTYAGMLQYDGDLQITEAFSGRTTSHPQHHGRMVCQGGHHPVRLFRNSEVWPCHLLLERQPFRQVRGRNLSGGAQRCRTLRAAPVDEGCRNRRCNDRRATKWPVQDAALQLCQWRHGWPHR
jgi:2,3-bisphosphoglycerate-independent phosphoglycerate mutase